MDTHASFPSESQSFLLTSKAQFGIGAVEALGVHIGDVYGVLETFNALLRIAQIETGARRAAFKRVDLAAIAAEVAEAFRPTAEDEGKTIIADTSVPLKLAGDKELLTQMIANLIDNALRHTPNGARISVRSAQTEGVPALVVSDNGPGVAAEEHARILERFYRLDAARATPGDGLGLSLVAAVVELHGLKLAFENNCPGLRIVVEITKSSEA